MQNGCPNNKVIFGIPTYGRTWKITEDSVLTGVPPLTVDGPGEAGPYTQQEGVLSYPEICSKIATPTEIQAGYLGKLRKVNDPTKRYGKCRNLLIPFLRYIYLNKRNIKFGTTEVFNLAYIRGSKFLLALLGS